MSENILFNAVVNGDRERVIKAIQEAIENGEKADIILQEGIVKGMAEVGRLFEEGEYFVPEMLIAARAVKDGLQVLKPYLQLADIHAWHALDRNVPGIARYWQIGLHVLKERATDIDLGGCGCRSVLGKNQEEKPDVLALSALLTTT